MFFNRLEKIASHLILINFISASGFIFYNISSLNFTKTYESLWCSDIWEDCVGHFRLHLASCGANRRQRLSSFFTEKSHPCSMYVLFWPDLPQVRHSMHLSVWLIQNIANERACKTTQFWTLRKKWTKGPSVWRLSSSSMDQVLSARWLRANMCKPARS